MAKWGTVESKENKRGYFVIDGMFASPFEIEAKSDLPWVDVVKQCKDYNKIQSEMGTGCVMHFEIRTVTEETQKVYFED